MSSTVFVMWKINGLYSHRQFLWVNFNPIFAKFYRESSKISQEFSREKETENFQTFYKMPRIFERFSLGNKLYEFTSVLYRQMQISNCLRSCNIERRALHWAFGFLFANIETLFSPQFTVQFSSVQFNSAQFNSVHKALDSLVWKLINEMILDWCLMSAYELLSTYYAIIW